MNELDRLARNAQRLRELHPAFARRIAAMIGELELDGLRPRIQDAWRSPADQIKAYESGHSKLRFGFHNVTGPTGQPESLAVDLLDDDYAAHEGAPYLLRLAAAAKRHACVTGIRWGLPAKLQLAVDAAIASADWSAAVKVGWDPTHVQPADVTLAAAKHGSRPA